MKATSCAGAFFTLVLIHQVILGVGFTVGTTKRGLRLALQLSIQSNHNPPHPYWTALQDASENIRHRYFFPGHGGNGPMEKGAMEKLDLPELDETDNIHAPEVSIVVYRFCSQLYSFIIAGSTEILIRLNGEAISIIKKLVFGKWQVKCLAPTPIFSSYELALHLVQAVSLRLF